MHGAPYKGNRGVTAPIRSSLVDRLYSLRGHYGRLGKSPHTSF